jgi:hypothetical protein
VTPSGVLSISQTIPRLLTTSEATSSRQQEQSAKSSETVRAASAKDTNKPAASSAAVDTVNITPQSLQAMADSKKDEAKKDEVAKKEAKNNTRAPEKADASPTKVQFVYDLKGELIIKYKDTANRVIYQVPSEMKMRQTELASKSNSTFTIKA